MPPPITAVVINLATPTAGQQPKQLGLSWIVTAGDRKDVDTFRVALKSSDASSYQVVKQIANSQLTAPINLPSLTALNWSQAKVQVQACDASNRCAYSNEQSISALLTQAVGYFKASDTHASDWFGTAVALSSDGSTLAVGTGNGNNDGVHSSVYIFQKTGDTWAQQTVLRSPVTSIFTGFGLALSLSSNGNILLVGAPYDGSNAKGIGGDPNNALAPDSGAAYVFTRTGTSWSTPVYVKASNTHTGDNFGASVAISGDGATFVVGAPYESSNATGVDGNENDTSVAAAGAVFVYGISNSIVTKKNYLKATDVGANYFFGISVALSANGNMLAIGESGEGTDGSPPPNNALSNSGAVYVYPRSGTQWLTPAVVKAFNPGQNYYFGNSVSLSADGGTMAVGSFGEASNGTGVSDGSRITPAMLDTSLPKAGAAYVYLITSTGIHPNAYIKASNNVNAAAFGHVVALSADGTTLAITAPDDRSAATGINGDQLNTTKRYAGAAFVFASSAGSWSQRAYVKSSNTDANDQFGYSLAISSDGSNLAIGAPSESSAATGIDGNQADNSVSESGAVYLY
ncbi:MAG TPA: hypothetical protein VHL14_03255 [Steroidobacteraceae bacterium]|nr:hypothetical protein [Steroidobacteraceae bacterium]